MIDLCSGDSEYSGHWDAKAQHFVVYVRNPQNIPVQPMIRDQESGDLFQCELVRARFLLSNHKWQLTYVVL